MEDVCCGCLGVGNTVPDFEIDTFEPATGKFGKFSLSAAIEGQEMDYSLLLSG